MRFGAVASAAAAFAVPAAGARTSSRSVSNTTETYLLAHGKSTEASQPPGNLTPEGMKAGRDGAKVLIEMNKNIRPNIVSSAVVELNAGTFLAYGPRKGSPGEKVAKGKVAFIEFPQLAVVDGRIVARGEINTGMVDDKSINSRDSRWVDVSSNTVLFYYVDTPSAKRWPLIIPVRPGGGNNLASASDNFEVPDFTELTLLVPDVPASHAKHQRDYLGLFLKPGPKPRLSDITKNPN